MAREVSAQLHVVTYVARGGDDTLEPVAFQTLNRPQPGAEGPAVEAVLGTVESFQCDGKGAGTNGCKELHGHANERVIARLNDKGKVAVTWRRYHPRVAFGEAGPGA